MTEQKENLSLSHGVMVIKDLFLDGDFVKSLNRRIGGNSYFGGSWEELEQLVTLHRDSFEGGTGSVDNDVILITVPADNFFTSVIAITDENKHLVEERSHSRQEGEKPVVSRFINGIKPPANFVKIVCYRADVLARDDNRTTDAEWEIIAILAQIDEVTPMNPTTMLRNNNHDKGGTYREYNQQQWDEAYAYWNTHAYVEEH